MKAKKLKRLTKVLLNSTKSAKSSRKIKKAMKESIINLACMVDREISNKVMNKK